MSTSPQPAGGMLCILAVLVPLGFAMIFFEPYLMAKQLLLVGGAALTLPVWLATAHDLPRTRLWWPLAALTLLGAVAMLHGGRGETGIALLAALALFAVSVSEFRTPVSRELLAALVTAAGVVEAVYVLWQAVATDPLLPAGDLPGKWRTFGTFGNPNWTGEFLAVAVLVTLGRLTTRFSRAGAIALALLIAALGATLARGAWLACVIGCAALLFARRQRPAPALCLALAGGVAAAGVLVVGIALRPGTLKYLANLVSVRGRVWMWAVSLRMLAEAPWGVGLGNFGRHFPEMQGRMFHTGWGQAFLRNGSFTPQAHNDYLQFAAEAGVVALPVMAALVWMVLRRGRALAPDGAALGMWAAVVALAVDALFASPFYLPGSLAMAALLLGATEAAAAAGERPLRLPARLAACAAGLALGAAALTWCWHAGAAQFELQRAATAVAFREWDGAANAAAAAIRHSPSLEAYSMQGRVRLARRDFDGAAESYLRAAGLGFDTDVFAGRATALWHAGRRPEAVQLLQELGWLRPDLEWPRRRLMELRATSAPGKELP